MSNIAATYVEIVHFPSLGQICRGGETGVSSEGVNVKSREGS